jgi:predicted ArsR family transcriptional regulator
MDGKGPGLAAVSSLEDPVRARLYQVVAGRARPVGRDEAAAAAGIGRPLAAYHLDKLVELGLLTASYQRPEGRTGPGAGRPPKLYARSEREFAVTVPPRDYEVAARLLAVAVECDATGQSQTALRNAARQYGANLGMRSRPCPTAGEAMETILRDHGFEPWRAEDGTVQLRNCPFHQLAALHPDMVCGMNLALVDGLITSLGASDMHPDLDPQRGRCCVVISADRPGANARMGRS